MTEIKKEAIDSAIREIECSGLFGNQMHKETLETALAALRRTAEHDKAMEEGRWVELPCKQYTTVYYLLDKRVFVGWYLAQVGETTHLILQDRIEMGICWVTDGAWFLTRQEAEAALSERGGEDG